MARLAHGERRPCEACGVMMLGVTGVSGKILPLVANPEDSKMEGNVVVSLQMVGDMRAVVIGKAEERAALKERDVRLWVNHFADCPERERFRREEES